MPEEYLLNSIQEMSPEFLSELKLWVEQAGIAIPFGQLVGFTQFVVQASTGAFGDVTSTSYMTLNGPSITGLPPGKYLLIYAMAVVNGPSETLMAISVNGDTPTDADAVSVPATGDVLMAATIRLVTLTGNSNTLTGMYRNVVSGSTGGVGPAWLLAVRYA